MLTRAPKPVLIVTTSHAILGDTGRPTGVWLEEVAAPYWAFRDAGLEVVIASPAGGEIPVDPASLLPDFLTSEAQRFRQDRAAQALMAGSTQLGTTPQEFAAILFAGGHGTMWDFPGNGEIASLLTGAFDKAVPVGAVCHGVAGLLASPSLAKGKRLTGFSNAEENAAGLDAVVPFLLETSLLDAGATYSAGPAFARTRSWMAFSSRARTLPRPPPSRLPCCPPWPPHRDGPQAGLRPSTIPPARAKLTATRRRIILNR